MRAPSEPIKGSSIDIEEFAKNLARMIEEGGKAMAAYLKPREAGHADSGRAEQMNEVARTLGQVAEYWLTDPKRALDLQSTLGKAYLDLWAHAARRMTGEPTKPVAAAGRSPPKLVKSPPIQTIARDQLYSANMTKAR